MQKRDVEGMYNSSEWSVAASGRRVLRKVTNGQDGRGTVAWRGARGPK